MWFSENATISILCTNSYIRAEVGNLRSKAYLLGEERLHSKFSHVSHLHCYKTPPIKALVLNTVEHAFPIGKERAYCDLRGIITACDEFGMLLGHKLFHTSGGPRSDRIDFGFNVP